MADLRQEFDFYREHQQEFSEQYAGKVIVIKDKCVVGVYDSELEAVQAAKPKFEAGSFLVQKVSPGDEETTQTFHSRVMFR